MDIAFMHELFYNLQKEKPFITIFFVSCVKKRGFELVDFTEHLCLFWNWLIHSGYNTFLHPYSRL